MVRPEPKFKTLQISLLKDPKLFFLVRGLDSQHSEVQWIEGEISRKSMKIRDVFPAHPMNCVIFWGKLEVRGIRGMFTGGMPPGGRLPGFWLSVGIPR